MTPFFNVIFGPVINVPLSTHRQPLHAWKGEPDLPPAAGTEDGSRGGWAAPASQSRALTSVWGPGLHSAPSCHLMLSTKPCAVA